MSEKAKFHTIADVHQRNVARLPTLRYMRRLSEEEYLQNQLKKELENLKTSIAETSPAMANLGGWYAGSFCTPLLLHVDTRTHT